MTGVQTCALPIFPEIPFTIDSICKKLIERREQEDLYSLIVVAEGAMPKGGEAAITGHSPDGTVLLGGIAHKIADAIDRKSVV